MSAFIPTAGTARLTHRRTPAATSPVRPPPASDDHHPAARQSSRASAFLGAAALVTTTAATLASAFFFHLQKRAAPPAPLPATATTTPATMAAPSSSPSSLSALQGLKTIDGAPLDAAGVFGGKVVFAMNVASACGYTRPGYDLLRALTDKYGAADFVAVAIPCNAFGAQESGSPDEIKTFALARAQRLVITERSEVNGAAAHPVVALARTKFPGNISWNFDGRFVFDREGKPVAKFGNSASAADIEAAIDKCI